MTEKKDESSKTKPILYAFNHTSGRFAHALGKDNFKNFSDAHKNRVIVIIEFGVGNDLTAVHNPPELLWYTNDENERFRVIKFWYDPDFDFTAKTQNQNSLETLEEYLKNFP